ncbi:MAG: hypothetical protein JSR13_13985 [Proteobacteria bacterium]|nr:hypothetical protein [Pseudomonadota bacterium]
MLRDHEKTAVMSILVRVVESMDERAELEESIANLNARLAEVKMVRTSATSALRTFGFDTSADGLWDRVKEAIGKEMYDRAFNIARPKKEQDASAVTKEVEAKAESEAESSSVKAGDEASAENSSSNEEREVSSEGDRTDSAFGETQTNIRELVLQFLGEAGADGAKATQLRQRIEGVGIDMHEKTVGMTLYRLKEAGQVKREGRTWFLLSTSQDNSTEGQDDAQASVETSQKGIFG